MDEKADAVAEGGGDGGGGTLTGDGAFRPGVLFGDGVALPLDLVRPENGLKKDHSDSN